MYFAQKTIKIFTHSLNLPYFSLAAAYTTDDQGQSKGVWQA